MSTNFYRLPTEDEMLERKEKLLTEVANLELNPFNICHRFETELENSWERENPWDNFIEGTKIHLGKRSGGWKFVWNFHNNKYYFNKEGLFSFIRSGRVVDEYGELIENEEFIEMALNWCQPDGYTYGKEYVEKTRKINGYANIVDNSSYYDKIIDGLNVSASTDFS